MLGFRSVLWANLRRKRVAGCYPRVARAFKVVYWSHAATGAQGQVRRPLSWSVLARSEGTCAQWGKGMRILWLARGGLYSIKTRTAEMFVTSKAPIGE